MIRQIDSFDFTKSSVCSLTSTTTTTIVSNIKQKKKVLKNLVSMYLSSFFIRGGKINQIWLIGES